MRSAVRDLTDLTASSMGRSGTSPRTALLDTPAEEAFDRLTRLAARLLEAPVALVALVDGGRQFFKSSVGLREPWASLRETPISHSFCALVVDRAAPLVIEDARDHALVRHNPAILELGVVAYVGVPLHCRGEALGALCVIDEQPRQWHPREIDLLGDLAASVMSEMELRVAYAELEQSRHLSRSLLDAAGEGIYGVDAEGLCTFANAACARLLGCSDASELVGQNMHALVHHADASGRLHALADCPIHEALRSGRSAHSECEVLWRMDKTSFHAEYRAEPLRSDGRLHGAVVTFSDITARRQSEDTLRETKELLERVIEQSGEGIIAADANGTVHIFNPAAEKQHGVGKQPVAAPQWAAAYGLLTPEGAPLPLEQTPLYRALRGEEVNDAAWLVRRPDGALRELVGTASPLRDTHGAIAGAVLITRDETERRHAEAEREAALAALEQSSRARDEVLGIVSHDLRNPLSVIVMSSAVLAAASDVDDRAKRTRAAAEKITRASQRMSRLIDDLVDLGAIRAGRLSIETAVHDIHALLRDVGDMHQGAAEERQIELVVSEAEAPLHGTCDRERVGQVLSNLIANALNVVKAGGRVTLRAARSGDHAVVSVEDTGPGIPEADRARIFDRYWRGARTAYKGTGLGLAIARGIVEAHGGTIWVDGDVGVGTTFRFTLPYARR